LKRQVPVSAQYQQSLLLFPPNTKVRLLKLNETPSLHFEKIVLDFEYLGEEEEVRNHLALGGVLGG
jgi:hypothetical protein